MDALLQDIRKAIQEFQGTRCLCGLNIRIGQLDWMQEGDMDNLEMQFDIQFKSIGDALLICPYDGVFSPENEVDVIKADHQGKTLTEFITHTNNNIAVSLDYYGDLLDDMTDDEISKIETEFKVQLRRTSCIWFLRRFSEPKTST